MARGFLDRIGFEGGAVVLDKGGGAHGVMTAEVADPPRDGLLQDAVLDRQIPRCPPKDTLARVQLFGLGVVLLGPGQGRDKRRPLRPEFARLGPGLDHIQTLRVCQQPFLRRHAGMIRDGPAVEVRYPALDQLPRGFVIRAQAGLGQQFGRRHPRLEDIRLPQGIGQRDPVGQRQLGPPRFGQIVDLRIGNAQIGAIHLVIGLHLLDSGGISQFVQLRHIGGKVHSTVTDFARLRGWSTSVPLAIAV